jgi:hypothetical protein
MYRPVDTRDNAAVEREVRLAHAALFPGVDPSIVAKAFGWILECYEGRHPGYLPLDTRYHDIEHTMQGTLCLVRLLRARAATGAAPELTPRMFELGLIAILFHDSGYLKHRDDPEGTGAKYTATHVNRSASMAASFLKPKGYSGSDIASIQNMIHCTMPDNDPTRIPFGSDLERIVGYAVGTSDLLGQMAADDYVDKLPALYGEFAEAARNRVEPLPSAYGFTNHHQLMRDTPAFWRDYVKPRLDREFARMYAFLNDPHPNGRNPYVDAVERNIELVRERIASAA